MNKSSKTFNKVTRELRSCEANKTVEGLKRDLGRWLNSDVPNQPKISVLWMAAATKKLRCRIKCGKTKMKGDLIIIYILYRESEMFMRQLGRLRHNAPFLS